MNSAHVARSVGPSSSSNNNNDDDDDMPHDTSAIIAFPARVHGAYEGSGDRGGEERLEGMRPVAGVEMV